MKWCKINCKNSGKTNFVEYIEVIPSVWANKFRIRIKFFRIFFVKGSKVWCDWFSASIYLIASISMMFDFCTWPLRRWSQKVGSGASPARRDTHVWMAFVQRHAYSHKFEKRRKQTATLTASTTNEIEPFTANTIARMITQTWSGRRANEHGSKSERWKKSVKHPKSVFIMQVVAQRRKN